MMSASQSTSNSSACSGAAPELETLFNDVFAEKPWFVREQLDEAIEARKVSGAAVDGAFPL